MGLRGSDAFCADIAKLRNENDRPRIDIIVAA
jgi:hypothetical protein